MKNKNSVYMNEEELVKAGFEPKLISHNPEVGDHCNIELSKSIFHSTVNYVNRYVESKANYIGVITYVGDGVFCFKCDETGKEKAAEIKSAKIKLITE